MTFVSAASAALVLVTALLVQTVPAPRRAAVLLAASAVFYVSASPGGAVWLAVAIAFTYGVGARLARLGEGRSGFWVGGATALLLAAMILPRALDVPHLRAALPWASLGVPLGVSYLTFRLISYLLDVSWGRAPPAASLVSFAAYVAFFPHVTSGPIQRHGEFADGLALPPARYDGLVAGMRLVLLGLVKKLVVANRLGALVDPVFSDPGRYGELAAVLVIYAFPLQLYFDFSGLTDLARGVSALLGVPAPLNFDRPFSARSVQEFWSRWHMSLTQWLRDYLFTPLHVALRQAGRLGLVIAVSANMLAVGLWHGLSWSFALFGALNALYVAVPAWRRAGMKKRPPVSKGWLRVALDRLRTYHLMAFAFVFFRAESVSAAGRLLGVATTLAGAPGVTRSPLPVAPVHLLMTLGIVLAIQVVERGARESWSFWRAGRLAPVLRWSVYYAGVLMLIFWGEWSNRTFIYARF